MTLSIKKLNRGLKLLLLVDGYDEVPTASRKVVSEKLLSYEASGIRPYHLTCRDFYQILELKLATARISPFDEEDQERFVTSFASAYGSKIRPKEMLDELRERGMNDLLHDSFTPRNGLHCEGRVDAVQNQKAFLH